MPQVEIKFIRTDKKKLCAKRETFVIHTVCTNVFTSHALFSPNITKVRISVSVCILEAVRKFVKSSTSTDTVHNIASISSNHLRNESNELNFIKKFLSCKIIVMTNTQYFSRH